jgi:hypothetical protein
MDIEGKSVTARTYGEGPTGIIVGWHGTSRSIASVLWLYSGKVKPMGTRDLELVNETR